MVNGHEVEMFGDKKHKRKRWDFLLPHMCPMRRTIQNSLAFFLKNAPASLSKKQKATRLLLLFQSQEAEFINEQFR
jgi:hypothetical protein